MGDDSRSCLKSWDHVEQIFPEAGWKHDEADLQLKQGHQSEDAQSTLAMFRAKCSFDPKGVKANESSSDRTMRMRTTIIFDDNSFEDARRKERRVEEKESENNSSDSTRSSQASLVDMSSVEQRGIGLEELARVSVVLVSSTTRPTTASKRRMATIQTMMVVTEERVVVCVTWVTPTPSEPPNKSEQRLGADFNEANILPGKRRFAKRLTGASSMMPCLLNFSRS